MFIYITFTDIPITVKSKLENSLMCSFMFSVLKIIRKLDLSTNESSNEVCKIPSLILLYLLELYSSIIF